MEGSSDPPLSYKCTSWEAMGRNPNMPALLRFYFLIFFFFCDLLHAQFLLCLDTLEVCVSVPRDAQFLEVYSHMQHILSSIKISLHYIMEGELHCFLINILERIKKFYNFP